MSIVKRKINGRNYYFNTITKKQTTETAYNRSKSASRSAKTQFKTAAGYACSKAGRDLKVKQSSSAGKKLRNCR